MLNKYKAAGEMFSSQCSGLHSFVLGLLLQTAVQPILNVYTLLCSFKLLLSLIWKLWEITTHIPFSDIVAMSPYLHFSFCFLTQVESDKYECMKML